jgi:hypothetical protein
MATAWRDNCAGSGMACSQCDDLLVAPKWPAYVSNHEIRHVWSCESNSTIPRSRSFVWARRHCEDVRGIRGGTGQSRLVDRSDPLTYEVAKLIIEFAKQGERDPERLCALTLHQLSKKRPRFFATSAAGRASPPNQRPQSTNGSRQYGAAARHALQSANLRRPAISRSRDVGRST